MPNCPPEQIDRFLHESKLGEVSAATREHWSRYGDLDRGIRSRLVLLPDSLRDASLVFVASSRLGRDLDKWPSWFAALRTLASRLAGTESAFITDEQTTAHRFVTRIGQLFSIPVVTAIPIPAREPHRFTPDAKRIGYTDPRPPTLLPEAPVEFAHEPADFALAEIADELFVLRATSGGNTYRAVTRRLRALTGSSQSSNRAPQSSHVLIDPKLSPPKICDELIGLGASGWWLYDGTALPTQRPNEIGLTESHNAWTRGDDFDDSRFLLHWTRGGNWQADEIQHLDRLLLGDASKVPGPLGSLLNILTEQRIRAFSRLTRTRQPVTCWTDVALREFPARRIFRRHLGRWDFEPFGIGVRKSCLESMGAKPVRYGAAGDAAKLSVDELPFFQLALSRSGQIDWRQEREWRTTADVDLRKISPADGFVFVDSPLDAAQVRPYSRWPIVVLNPV